VVAAATGTTLSADECSNDEARRQVEGTHTRAPRTSRSRLTIHLGQPAFCTQRSPSRCPRRKPLGSKLAFLLTSCGGARQAAGAAFQLRAARALGLHKSTSEASIARAP
jgi:hypothetical protein